MPLRTAEMFAVILLFLLSKHQGIARSSSVCWLFFAANNSKNSGGALFFRWAPPLAVALN